MNLVLIGMMGSGKSTVGKIMAGKLKWKFLDSDRLIEQEEKRSIPEIFQGDGEASFREKEKKMIVRLAREDRCVIAAGGGAPVSPEFWDAVSKSSSVIWLKAKPETLFTRLKDGGAKSRPLLADSLSVEKISRILKAREPFYQKANWTIETDGLKPEEAADKILRLSLVKSK